MRRTVVLTLLVLLVPLAVCSAIPAPPFDETVPDVGAYNVDVTKTAVSSGWEYQWTVAFNGTSLFGPDDPDGDPIQRMHKFVVYGCDSVGLVDAYDSTAPPWWAAVNPGNNALVEWVADKNVDRLRIGDSIVFTAVLDSELTCDVTAIQVQYGEDSEWVTNTPELPPSLLSVLGFGSMALVGRIRRRLRR